MTERVTLVTDFGTTDGYVGAMKGAILCEAPDAALVDVSHDIPAGDIRQAGYVLAQAAPWFPPDTVHLAVVDPGVGGPRRALAARLRLDGGVSATFVAPDNGLLTRVLARAEKIESAVALAPDPSRRVSAVFHGRDLFGPAAGRLAAGVALDALGQAIDPDGILRLPEPGPERAGDELDAGWNAPIVHVDRFGNLVTNLPIETGARGVARCGDALVSSATTYSDVAVGELVALRGSEGTLEVACRDGSAARALGLGLGHVIHWRPIDAPISSTAERSTG